MGLAEHEAAAIAPTLKTFWASIAAGDPQIDFSHLSPEVQERLAHFNSVDSDGNPQAIDNTATLVWRY